VRFIRTNERQAAYRLKYRPNPFAKDFVRPFAEKAGKVFLEGIELLLLAHRKVGTMVFATKNHPVKCSAAVDAKIYGRGSQCPNKAPRLIFLLEPRLVDGRPSCEQYEFHDGKKLKYSLRYEARGDVGKKGVTVLPSKLTNCLGCEGNQLKLLRELHVEGVDFVSAGVADKERSGKAAPGSNPVPT
jgi:hypothetical protein